VSKLEFAARIVLLVLGWVLVIARAVTVGLHAGTLWSGGGLLAISLALALVRSMPGPPPTRKPPDPETLSKGERLSASTPGKVVTVLSVAVLAIGMGSIAGVLVCLPLLGPAETVITLPDILGRAALAATLSAVGFVILVVVIALLGTRILSGVFEHWAAYIAPVIGGVTGAVLESGATRGSWVGEVLENGAFATGLLVVGLSALVGGVASIIYEGIQSKRLTVESLGETTIAGLGIGAINGFVLALILGILGMLR
jgi:hypothetical protein